MSYKGFKKKRKPTGDFIDNYARIYQLCAYIFVIMSFPPHMFVNS